MEQLIAHYRRARCPRDSARRALVTERASRRSLAVGRSYRPPDRTTRCRRRSRQSPGYRQPVAITLDGVEHTFHEDGGTDLGDYVGPHFTQRCICVTMPTLPGVQRHVPPRCGRQPGGGGVRARRHLVNGCTGQPRAPTPRQSSIGEAGAGRWWRCRSTTTMGAGAGRARRGRWSTTSRT